MGDLAEVSAKHLKKGSLVSVEGPIRSQRFTHKEGVERYAFEVIANEVLFLDRAERQKPEDPAPPVGGEDNPF
jgi:single-strand DNA-binding protein